MDNKKNSSVLDQTFPTYIVHVGAVWESRLRQPLDRSRLLDGDDVKMFLEGRVFEAVEVDEARGPVDLQGFVNHRPLAAR